MSHVVVVHPNTGYKTTYPADLLNELGTKNNTCETSYASVTCGCTNKYTHGHETGLNVLLLYR